MIVTKGVTTTMLARIFQQALEYLLASVPMGLLGFFVGTHLK